MRRLSLCPPIGLSMLIASSAFGQDASLQAQSARLFADS
jgi:hypothetical protein